MTQPKESRSRHPAWGHQRRLGAGEIDPAWASLDPASVVGAAAAGGLSGGAVLHLWWTIPPAATSSPHRGDPGAGAAAAVCHHRRLGEVENSTNERCWNARGRKSAVIVLWRVRPVYDRFSGGGSVPLEGAAAGPACLWIDLNPVAVMISRAMIQDPAESSRDMPHPPGIKDRSFYPQRRRAGRGDVKYYGNGCEGR